MTRLALAQFSCSTSYPENIDKAIYFVKEAKKLGASLLLLPELFERNYFCQKMDPARFAYAEEEENSKTLSIFSNLAKQEEIVLPISFFEKDKDKFYNSIVVFDKDGRKLGKYRKTHIPSGNLYEEKYYFSSGDTGFQVFHSSAGNIGIGICWDQWFLETGRSLALLGADYLLFPTAIGSEPDGYDSKTHWQNVMKGQAALNILPVLAANRIGKEEEKDTSITFYGSSFIADEIGEVVEEASRDEERILFHDFDLDKIKQRREDWSIFDDRHPEMYHLLTKEKEK